MTTTEQDKGPKPTPGANAWTVTAGNREAASHGVTNEHTVVAEGGMADWGEAVAGSEIVGGSEVITRVGVPGGREVAAEGGVVGQVEAVAGSEMVGGSEVVAGREVAGEREVVAGRGVVSELGHAMDGGRAAGGRGGVAGRGGAVARGLGRVEVAFVGLAGRFGVPALRITLALTFLWFGVLKITNDTPVGGFVAGTVDWIPGVSGSWFVPFLGVVEVLLGAALLVGRGLRIVLPLLFAHLAGTFLALVTQPEVTFQGGNPVMLTTEGEFVVKNLILLSAVLVLYGLQRARVARS